MTTNCCRYSINKNTKRKKFGYWNIENRMMMVAWRCREWERARGISSFFFSTKCEYWNNECERERERVSECGKINTMWKQNLYLRFEASDRAGAQISRKKHTMLYCWVFIRWMPVRMANAMPAQTITMDVHSKYISIQPKTSPQFKFNSKIENIVSNWIDSVRHGGENGCAMILFCVLRVGWGFVCLPVYWKCSKYMIFMLNLLKFLCCCCFLCGNTSPRSMP